MALVIEIKTTKTYGLETFHVCVNGTLLHSFMSEQFAIQKAKNLLHAWTVEKVQHKVKRKAS